MTTAATMIAALFLSGWQPSPDVEIAAIAILRGVPPVLALAVSDAETGNIPARTRDTVISRGNVGRLQIRASTWWKPLGYANRRACIRALQDRHTNIKAGVAILATFARRYQAEGLPAIAGHYNAGGTLGEAGTRYAGRVAAHMARRLRWSRDVRRAW